MAFWNKDKKAEDLPKHADLGRNDPCHCGSGKKYKKCCMEKDQTAERKTLEENWAKSAAEVKAEAEKNAKESKETPASPTKHGSNPQSIQSKHQKFVPSQVSTPRKSGGG
jgi:hypothetical protein